MSASRGGSVAPRASVFKRGGQKLEVTEIEVRLGRAASALPTPPLRPLPSPRCPAPPSATDLSNRLAVCPLPSNAQSTEGDRAELEAKLAGLMEAWTAPGGATAGSLSVCSLSRGARCAEALTHPGAAAALLVVPCAVPGWSYRAAQDLDQQPSP